MLASTLVVLAPLVFVLSLVPAAALPGATPRPAPAAADPRAQRDLQRAVVAYGSLQRAYGVPGTNLVREEVPYAGGNAYSFLWPYSHLLAATISLSQLPGVGPSYRADLAAQLAGLEAYWEPNVVPPAYLSYVPPPLGSGGDRFYDDNVWIGLELAQVAELGADPGALNRARQVFAYMRSGWDRDPTHPNPGGIYWVDAPWDRQRSTVSTAFAALLGFRLYELTRDRSYLDDGMRFYDWTNRYMQAPDGLYWDHVDLGGQVDTWENSYNQGAMIGADLALYRITGDSTYRAHAVRIADTALTRYGDFTVTGAQHSFTNVIFFDNLMALARLTCTPAYLAATQQYADRLWALAAATPQGLLQPDPSEPAKLLDQASLVELYAQLALGAPACPGDAASAAGH